MSFQPPSTAMDLSGRAAVVTGGARGIGAAVSTLFAAAGASVVIDHLPIPPDLAALEEVTGRIRALRGRVETFAGDVASPAQMEALVARAVEAFGGLDVVVHSAGFAAPATAEALTPEAWRTSVEVNLSGAFYVTRAALPHLRPGGRIVYVGSAGAISGGGGSAAYSAAKAGIHGLVRALAKELAPRGITVNAILPALIDTDLLRDRQPDPVRRAEYARRVPLGRLGRPEDVASMALFLASSHASFVTGQLVLVDGGATHA